MKLKSIALAALLPLTMAASTLTYAGEQYTLEANQQIVKKTNWEKMETVTVDLEEFAYAPEDFVFKVGQPYKLVMKNIGDKKHYFTAPEFFRAIATRKVQSNKDGEIKVPYLLALEMMAKGGQLDLYFVPVQKGSYPVYCTVDDHREQGMEGTIVIK